jgi:pimeloyl-ACP methyl ester carboxylesterase
MPPPEGFEHGHADLDGMRIHHVHGGSGPAVVLLHGYPFTWIVWRKVMPLLAQRGFRVIAPDLRGSGDSSIPTGHWTKRDEAEDLHRLLHRLGHDRTFLVGMDQGAMTAHAWAQAYPDEITRLVLSEAFLPGYGLEDHTNPAFGGFWHFGFHTRSELAATLTAGREDEYLSSFWSVMFRHGAIPDADRAELLRTYTAPDGMRGGFEHYASIAEDVRAARAGGRILMPVLVLNGEHGLPQKILLDGVREAATDVRADVIADGAHTYALDEPEATAERLARFFTTEPAT